MFLTTRKEIEIREYTNGSVSTLSAHSRSTGTIYAALLFNGAQLAYAIARTTCSSHLNSPELWFDFVIAFLQTRSIVADTGLEFRLVDSRLNRIRDFSRTSRVGELAQGISYLFAQNVLNYPIVIDYHTFMLDNGVDIPNNKSTPDFILQKQKYNKKIGVLESKGTLINSSTSIKDFLFKGLNQCQKGKDLIAANHATASYTVSNKYAVCSEFSLDSEPQKSLIHFVDPEEQSEQDDFDDRIMKHHYASWFYLIGDFPNVRRLINNEAIVFDKKLFSEYKYSGETYYILAEQYIYMELFKNIEKENFADINNFFLYRLLVERIASEDYILGISRKIVSHLTGETRLEEMPIFTVINEANINVFADGTIFSYNASKS